MIRSLFVSILFTFSSAVIAQEVKVSPELSKAKFAYETKQYKTASVALSNYIAGKYDASNTGAISMLADCFWNMRSYSQAKFCYDQLAQIGASLSATEKFRISELYAMAGDYNKAQSFINGMPGYQDKMNGYKNTSALLIDSLDYSVQYLNLNSNKSKEFSPSLINNSLFWVTNMNDPRRPARASAIDGANLFSIRKIADTSSIKGVDYSMVEFSAVMPSTTSKKLAQGFEGSDKELLTRIPKFDNKKLNQQLVTGALVLGAKTSRYYNVSHIVYAPVLNKYFLTLNHKKANSKKDKDKTLFIAQANLIDGVLQNIEEIKLGDVKYSYMHPAIDPSGLYMVFSSNSNPDNNFDLFYAVKDSTGWSAPLPLQVANTKGDEVFPSFSNTGDLYFSSNGRAGLGGLDIYSIQSPFAGTSPKIKTLSFPINSKNDDFGVAATPDPSIFYFSSDRLGTDDIYQAKFAEVVYKVSGKISFLSDATLVPSTKLYLKKRGDEKFTDSLSTDGTSSYSLSLRPNRLFDIYIDDNGTKKLIDSFNTSKVRSSIEKNILMGGQSFVQRKDSLDKLQAQFKAFLQKRAADSLLAVAIPNEFRVHYDFNKAELDKNDKFVLDSLVNVLKLNDKLQVSIGSFTDCKGNAAYNQKLSAKRSKVVVAYLKKKGVASSRFISSYYGKSYFVQACLTGKYSKSSQIVNRRTELLLTERKNTTWDVLHQSINEATHKILSSLQVPLVKPVKFGNKPVVKEVKKPVVKVAPAPKVDTIKVSPVVKEVKKPVVKVAPAPKVDTIKVSPVVKEVKKPVVKVAPAPKVDTIKVSPVVKEVKKPVVKVAPAPKVEEAEESISKAEILQALDSLAKLKSEQERIVNYLTKRINKKPILIYTSSDSVNVEIYDSGIHDKDSVSIIYNNRIVVDRKELNVKNPIKFGLRVSNNPSANQLIFVAENLGYDPPNTAVMIITDKNNKRQEIILNTDLTHNEVVKFIKIVKN